MAFVCKQTAVLWSTSITLDNNNAVLRLDNTGAWAIEVYPSLLCNRVSEHVDLYIKIKPAIFSLISY